MEEVEGAVGDITFFVNGNKVNTLVSLYVIHVCSIHAGQVELP